MKCPIRIEARLVMTERQGIEIDCCPKCRGVWLDRGELDKIGERSLATVARTGIDGCFIGNTAETVLQRVARSVLTVKPEGFVSPVKLD